MVMDGAGGFDLEGIVWDEPQPGIWLTEERVREIVREELWKVLDRLARSFPSAYAPVVTDSTRQTLGDSVGDKASLAGG